MEFKRVAKRKAEQVLAGHKQKTLRPVSGSRRRCERQEIPHVVAALFAGIGGIELGLHKSGHDTALFCEIDAPAAAVLRARFTSVPCHDDVRTLASLPRETSLLTAGFPCQDLSQAGKTQGISGGRSGLVGEVFRLLEQQRIPWVLIENVPFMLHLQQGRALSYLLDSFEALDYRWAYRVVDSRAFGLPQRRERVYLLATLDGDPRDVLLADDAGAPIDEPDHRDVACGFYWTEGIRGLGWAVDAVPTLKGGSTIGIPSPPAILLPSGAIVTPDIRDVERLQGFPADWTAPASDVGRSSMRWKLVGNSVTVDVAAWIGRRLLEPGHFEDELVAELARDARWPRAAYNVGNGRFAASASAWPLRCTRPALSAFLRYPTSPLSEKATAGFLSRTRTSTLRFPEGFITAIEAHLARMRRGSARTSSTVSRRRARGDAAAPAP